MCWKHLGTIITIVEHDGFSGTVVFKFQKTAFLQHDPFKPHNIFPWQVDELQQVHQGQVQLKHCLRMCLETDANERSAEWASKKKRFATCSGFQQQGWSAGITGLQGVVRSTFIVWQVYPFVPLFSLFPWNQFIWEATKILGNCWLWPEKSLRSLNLLWLIRTPPCPSKVHSWKLWKNTTVLGQRCIPQSWKSTTTMLCIFMGWRPLGKQGLICKPKQSFFWFGPNTLWPLAFRCESGWSGWWSLADAGEPLALREVRTIRQGFGNSESQSQFRVEINATHSIVLFGCWWFVV